ncbi:putative Alpha/beta hydrolase fold-1 [Seiridium cardinale]|uniref:Alpha/beta hydrolase fold-1 n=1 Tax=Seiridium cardinale TaxID=138064 RepID=A0ABR2XGY4_9PEZI
MAPTVFIVPGLWEGPAAFEPLRDILRAHGLKTFATSLKSTGTRAPGNPTMSDDIEGIHADFEKVVEEAGADGVIAIMHSAGGFIGSGALKGLTAPAREYEGRLGGVRKIIFIAAGIAPEGSDRFGGPFIKEQDDGSAVCVDSQNSLFHDLSPKEAEGWQNRLEVHPTLDNWKVAVPYCGWKDVPSIYILCELDRLLPVHVQQMMAELAGSETVRLEAGHMAQLSRPDAVAEVVLKAATGQFNG